MIDANSSRTPLDLLAKLGNGGTPVSDPSLYHHLAGALQHLTFTHPDISFAVQQICLYMHEPQRATLPRFQMHFEVYLGNSYHDLQLYSSPSMAFTAYSDADCALSLAGPPHDFFVFLGDNLISWSSKQEHNVSRSSAECPQCLR